MVLKRGGASSTTRKGSSSKLLMSFLVTLVGAGVLFMAWGHIVLPTGGRLRKDDSVLVRGVKKHPGEGGAGVSGGVTPVPAEKRGELDPQDEVNRKDLAVPENEAEVQATVAVLGIPEAAKNDDEDVEATTKPKKKPRIKRTTSGRPKDKGVGGVGNKSSTGNKKPHNPKHLDLEAEDSPRTTPSVGDSVDINQQVLSLGKPPPNAYMMIISNEDFIDGALVLGVTLRSNSEYLASGKAHLVILVASGRLSQDSKYRLRYFGFDRIVEIQTLANRAPGAALKDTFDKLYMFNLTSYEKIIFMDADMLNVKGADDLFKKDYEEGYVGGIGHHGSGSYFQTGMMVFRPSTKVFDKIMEEFNGGTPPRGQKYNRGMMGRDGVLIRNVFGESFKIISDSYSRNLNPRNKFPKDLRSLHFRGKFKPWMNRILPNPDPEMGKKEFGFGYVKWWEIYQEDIHQKSPEFLVALHSELQLAGKDSKKKNLLAELVIGGSTAIAELEVEHSKLTKKDLKLADRALAAYGKEAYDEMATVPRPIQAGGDPVFAPFSKDPLTGHLAAPPLPLSPGTSPLGGVTTDDDGDDTKKKSKKKHRHDAATKNFSPLTHLYMMRNTKKHYIQYSWLADRYTRQYEEPAGYRLVVGPMGDSCDAACGGRGLRCLSDYLYHSTLQDCTVLQEQFGSTVCTECQPGIYWRHHPGNEQPSVEITGLAVKGTQGVCWYNMLHDDRAVPNCAAYMNSTQRLCPCGPESTKFPPH